MGSNDLASGKDPESPNSVGTGVATLAKSTGHTADSTSGAAADGFADDLRDVASLDIVTELLGAVCDLTGMRFAAIARVTQSHWVAMAVRDEIAFGLAPGGHLDIDTTFCKSIVGTGTPILFDHAGADPRYRDHPTPRLYGFESYVSVPIMMGDGSCFGTLCALDPMPLQVDTPRIRAQFRLYARLIALQLENHRRRAIAEAAVLDERAASELREQFIAILGHDLRNPLQGISSGAQLLARRRRDDDEVVQLTDRIRHSVGRMSALIDDVLDLARGRLGGGFGVDMIEVDDLDQAFSIVAAEFADSHPDRRITAQIDVERPVRCDRARLQQLASNLLGNALAHGSSEGPIVFVASTAGKQLTIAVSNQGTPIPADSLPHVFSPFWRRSTSSSREGLGLGLFICSQIVKAHHGTLEVASSRDEGTRFVARIPLDP